MVNKGYISKYRPPASLPYSVEISPPASLPCPIRDTHPIYWHFPQKYI